MTTKFSGTPEGEMIRILMSIETTLKSTSFTKKEVNPAKGSSAAAARIIKAEVSAAIKPLTTKIAQTSDAFKNLRDTTLKLNRHLETSRTRFTGLNGEMGKLITKLKNTKFSSDDFDKSIFAEAGKVGQELQDARVGVRKLNNQIGISTSKFEDLNISIGKFLENLNPKTQSVPLSSDGLDGLSNVFDSTDVVKAIVDTKHVIQNGIKAYTENSNKNTNSIIEAINKLSFATAEQANLITPDQTSNPVLEQTNKILQQSATSQAATTAPNSSTNGLAQEDKKDLEAKQDSIVATQANTDAQNSAATAANSLATANTSAANAAQKAANNTALLDKSNLPLRKQIGWFLMAEARKIKSTELAKSSLDSFAAALTSATHQFFKLANMGMGSIGNMYELNVAALKSGMSVKDYTEMFVKNMEFASRAGSIENFQAITSANNAYLRDLGVFGEDAKRLQVTLANTATAMGISQKDIPDASRSLISVFERLQKTVSMTSNEFAEVVNTVAESNAFRNESVGLDKNERQARLTGLVETYNLGREMKLSAEEANKLGKAMLEQRKMTVKDRLKESANLMRMAMLTGNAQMIPELQSLGMKRIKSPEEEKRYAELLGQIEIDNQRMLNYAAETGQLSTEAALQDARSQIGSDNLSIMEGVARAKTADDSSTSGQEAFGKHIGFFGKAVGYFGEIVDGMRNSEILSPLLSGLVAGLGFIFSKQLVSAIVGAAKLIRRGPTFKLPDAGGSDGTSVGGKLKNFFSSAYETVKNGASKLGSSLSEIKTIARSSIGKVSQMMTSIFNTAKSAMISGANLLKSGGSVIGNVLKNMPSSISGWFSSVAKAFSFGGKGIGMSLKAIGAVAKSIPVVGWAIGAAIDATLEMISGDLRNAFSPNGGFFNTVGSVLLSIPYGMANLVVSSLEFIFGDNLLKPVRTVLDSLGAGIMAGVNTLVSWMAKSVSWLASFLPDDSGLKKMVDSWSNSAAKTAEESTNTFKRAMDGETLAKISKENKDRLENQTTATPESDQRKSLIRKSEKPDESKLPDSTKNTGDDAVLTALNSILQVLTDIRDQSKLSNSLDKTFDGIPFRDSLGFGNTGDAQGRILRNQ